MTRARDLPDAIQWQEGMLLAPQHFQQLSMRNEGLVAYHVLAGMPYCWGVRHLELDQRLLAAGTLRVNELEAVMPDGLVVFHSADDPQCGSLEIKLDDHAEQLQHGDLTVYLSVVSTAVETVIGERFRPVAGSLINDENREAESIEVPRLRPNLQLLAGDAPTARYASFPLAVVTRDNQLLKLSPFVPPLLQVLPTSPLHALCSELVVQLREKSVYLAKQTSIPLSRVEDRLHYLELRERLRSMVVMLPYLEAVLQTEGVHPYPLYLALCSMAGPLSLLRPGAVPPPPAAYRHEDLRRTFDEQLGHLNNMLEAVSQSYRETKFKLDGDRFLIPLDPAWLGDRLIVGLKGQSDRDLEAWMEGSLIGAESVLAGLRDRRILGAQRTRIDRAEELGLVAGAGVSLYAIKVDPAFISPNQILVIINPGEASASSRPAEIVLYAQG